ncbi:glycoside hydrolase family 9 protein [Microbulbifer thermotolerans]|uniref:glycoside hydrolase family 9 protein n=1 Tax=Microbulbifer thermotolerans TaxID=252514 RepID=UPI0008E207D8|nr:glycoside hydrolase family 9 protein [Microbulbifer thermotolerans]MCX2783049.1 glycoside hydrolase family 9 protein [Microbulbifer thermotolerans]MCX2795419.1 glycoside hydrolase family 9 protein [Microbulbifer thermotolerans]WKT60008.1 glycoside hydrolase family 9 protein [Microbulbifer thermotolerans]SFC52057.1 endoglucanase [Microbulbifer thermotolerans]
MTQQHPTKTGGKGSHSLFPAALCLMCLLTFFSPTSSAEQLASGTALFRLNQLGYAPEQRKIALVFAEENPGYFLLREHSGGDPILKGSFTPAPAKSWSGKPVWIANFSTLKKNGLYRLEIPGRGSSLPFAVNSDVYGKLARASLKAFYFQRASTDLDAQYAGRWARRGGHADREVEIHPSAAGTSRPAGATVASPGGWYDAGDYNKYIVNSGIATATLLSAYERYPRYFTRLELGIPESGNPLPDILDEARYNLRWMLTMQDPADGGVYHKLTTARFEGMTVAPADAGGRRYLVQKSTAATLDFAAVMAQAARLYSPFSAEEADKYLRAAERAWTWAAQNPGIPYRQEALNRKYDPDIHTGAYSDEYLEDERLWAAAELFISTGNTAYRDALQNAPIDYQLPSWSQVQWLGHYSLIRREQELKHLDLAWLTEIKRSLLKEAERLRHQSAQTAYQAPMVTSKTHFVWGSNSVAANQGILFLEAYHLTGDVGFLHSAADNLDYLLGRNATGYSYVTGFGGKSPQHPHHRLAAAQPALPPLPGFLVGGPNPAQQDNCDYPSDVADESYTDTLCSYASNEIAINWNAPLAYLVNGLIATTSKQQ